MPTATLNGVSYAYVDAGSGPLVVFGHGLLGSREMFRAQIDALSDRYRCVSVDWPGHGESGWREDGWTLEDMADDAAALVRALGAERAVFAGLSQGGMAFMRLALRRPELVAGLVLMDTSAGPEVPETLPQYRELARILREGSDEERAAIMPVVQGILYGPKWVAANPQGAAHERELMLSHPREGLFLAAQAVFGRGDVLAALGSVGAPTLVICGEDDVATPPERSREIVAAIPGASLVTIPDAGHHSAIENPAPVTAAMESFLAELGAW